MHSWQPLQGSQCLRKVPTSSCLRPDCLYHLFRLLQVLLKCLIQWRMLHCPSWCNCAYRCPTPELGIPCNFATVSNGHVPLRQESQAFDA